MLVCHDALYIFRGSKQRTKPVIESRFGIGYMLKTYLPSAFYGSHNDFLLFLGIFNSHATNAATNVGFVNFNDSAERLRVLPLPSLRECGDSNTTLSCIRRSPGRAAIALR